MFLGIQFLCVLLLCSWRIQPGVSSVFLAYVSLCSSLVVFSASYCVLCLTVFCYVLIALFIYSKSDCIPCFLAFLAFLIIHSVTLPYILPEITLSYIVLAFELHYFVLALHCLS